MSELPFMEQWRNNRLLKRYGKTVNAINALEPRMAALSDGDLAAITPKLRERVQAGEKLEAILPEAFAALREASRRVLGMRHFDCQMLGGIALNEGKIAEMRTGEGKTLVATLPSYLNALSGEPVHVVTVNDYLARRDAEQMGKLLRWMGLSVGVALDSMERDERREAYRADITYATNTQIGFDYLRDNTAGSVEDRLLRGLGFALVDEVDSILIDEARTPLIISGPDEGDTEHLTALAAIAAKMVRQQSEDGSGDYWVDEKQKQVHLSEQGLETAERLIQDAGLIPDASQLFTDPHGIPLVHQLDAALRAHALFRRDTEYVVRDGEILIVDEFTGRTMDGRRWGDGLHQAIEAKEGLKIEPENRTLASITYQNLFRSYGKLCGMTGTAQTEAQEFLSTYGLETVTIPTHRPTVREDLQDRIYLNREAKEKAVTEAVIEAVGRGQPVLVGTATIEASETLSDRFAEAGIAHEVLNAKQHEREAQIIAQAGRPGSVTIATNMAGRGTDIVLGGAPDPENMEHWNDLHRQAVEAGGLLILGTERHESRRIDNQLRGRSGRQGDPGRSQFYLSMDDSLMRIFGGPKMAQTIGNMGMTGSQAIESRIVSRQISGAQRSIERHNFDIRKQVLEYDNVYNQQRREIYALRNEILEGGEAEIRERMDTLRETALSDMCGEHLPPDSLPQQRDPEGLAKRLNDEYLLQVDPATLNQEPADATETVIRLASASAAEREQKTGPEAMRSMERMAILDSIDHNWREHLNRMDLMRRGIGLRGFAQKDPKQEFKREGFRLFASMIDDIGPYALHLLVRAKETGDPTQRLLDARNAALALDAELERVAGPATPNPPISTPTPEIPGTPNTERDLITSHARLSTREERSANANTPSRNDPCPCGSGKRFKHCHGALNRAGAITEH